MNAIVQAEKGRIDLLRRPIARVEFNGKGKDVMVNFREHVKLTPSFDLMA